MAEQQALEMAPGDLRGALDAETQVTEELFRKIRDHYDGVMESSRRVPGSLKFLSDQAENLISLRGQVLAVIKAKADLAHKDFGNTIRMKALSIKENRDDDSVPLSLVKHLIDALRVGPDRINGMQREIDITPQEDSDALLDVRLAELPAAEVGPAKVSYDPDKMETVCDETGAWHVVSNGTLVCDDEYDMPAEPPVFDAGRDGEIRAYGPGGTEIKVVRRDALQAR